MCHAAKSIVLSFAAQWISVSGRCWEGKALERNWSFGRTDTKPIQDRYESGVCCANPCKTDTGKKLVGPRSALQQYPRLTESVPNRSASSYIYIYIPYHANKKVSCRFFDLGTNNLFLLGGCRRPDLLLFLGGFQPPRPPGGGPAAPRAPSLNS